MLHLNQARIDWTQARRCLVLPRAPAGVVRVACSCLRMPSSLRAETKVWTPPADKTLLEKKKFSGRQRWGNVKTVIGDGVLPYLIVHLAWHWSLKSKINRFKFSHKFSRYRIEWRSIGQWSKSHINRHCVVTYVAICLKRKKKCLTECSVNDIT